MRSILAAAGLLCGVLASTTAPTAVSARIMREAWIAADSVHHGARPRAAARYHPRAIRRAPGAAEDIGGAAAFEMLDLINAERARAGDAPLRLSDALDAIARARSRDMTDRHYFSHEIPGVGTVFAILDHDGIGYRMAGENIALNNDAAFYGMVETIRRTNDDLMNSPEHRANILEPAYSEVGLGIALDPRTDQLIVTEVFVQP